MKYLDELKALKLPEGEYSIFGSGPLAIRKMRENKDIDIIVTKNLWNELAKSHPVKGDKLIQIGNINIYKSCPYFDDVAKLIEDSDIIDTIRFVRLADVLRWKRLMAREKDQRDILLIENYLKERGRKESTNF